MADFQTKVSAPARGAPGQLINPDSLVTTALNYISDGSLEPGGFAFAEAPVADRDMSYAYKSKSGGQLLGIVVRTDTGAFDLPTYSAAKAYHKGASVTIAARGQIEAKVPSGQTPTQGQAVLCDPATGAVTYGNKGDPNDTGWRVIFFHGQASANEDDLVIYENLGG